MTNNRWEHGSEFHWPDIPDSAATELPWPSHRALFGCGRDALRALLEHGRSRLGWQRLWMPSYFCQDVVAAAKTSIEVAAYVDAPGSALNLEDVPIRHGDALFVTSYFGLRSSPAVPPGVAIVEDHTHDPWSEWSRSSSADFCLVSLRKTLPLPDGGLVWSPRQQELPAAVAVTAERAAASANKTAGMLLKRLYLDGRAVSKEQFRALLLAGEERLASGPVSGMPALTEALLGALPLQQWRLQRRRNHRAFCDRLQAAAPAALQVLQPDQDDGCVPFSIILIADRPERRDAIRQRLVAQRIYPAVLWPLEQPEVEGIPPEHIQLSRRMLSLHCDFRYTEANLMRVAEAVIGAATDSSLGPM